MNETITKRIPVCELLAGLAEEAAELTQAALKLRRCYDGTNPTPADPVSSTSVSWRKSVTLSCISNS